MVGILKLNFLAIFVDAVDTNRINFGAHRTCAIVQHQLGHAPIIKMHERVFHRPTRTNFTDKSLQWRWIRQHLLVHNDGLLRLRLHLRIAIFA